MTRLAIRQAGHSFWAGHRRGAAQQLAAARRRGGAAASQEAAVSMQQWREGEDLGRQEQHADHQGSAAGGPWNRHGNEG